MSSLRERKKAATRRAILEASESLFRARGFAETRVRDIIDRVEISEPTFFTYFASKQAVIDQLAAQWLQDIVNAWPTGDSAASSGKPLFETLTPIFKPFIEAIEADRAFMQMVLTHASLWNPQGAMQGKHAEQGHPLNVATRAGFDVMADFFRQAQARGELRADVDALQLSEIAFGVFRITLQLWASNYWQVEHNLAERLNTAFDVLFAGMGVSND